MDDSWKHYAKGKKPETKGHILCDSIYRKYTEESNSEKESILAVLVVGDGGNGSELINEHAVIKMSWT